MEKRDGSEEQDKRRTPGEKRYADFEPAEAPIAPDGGIAPGYGAIGETGPQIPRASDSLCSKGPCRYYWRLVTLFDYGNPSDTWEHLGTREPRQAHHTCLVQPGLETDLGDDCVFECSMWEPLTEAEVVQINSRREDYYRRFPAERPDEGDEETE